VRGGGKSYDGKNVCYSINTAIQYFTLCQLPLKWDVRRRPAGKEKKLDMAPRIKKDKETNIYVRFIECTDSAYYEFQATSCAAVCYNLMLLLIEILLLQFINKNRSTNLQE
jgi:hypothetical protein